MCFSILEDKKGGVGFRRWRVKTHAHPNILAVPHQSPGVSPLRLMTDLEIDSEEKGE
jgi:hypothetical protein